jgi:hypothetical protein
MVAQLVMKVRASYEARTFMTVHTTARQKRNPEPYKSNFRLLIHHFLKIQFKNILCLKSSFISVINWNVMCYALRTTHYALRTLLTFVPFTSLLVCTWYLWDCRSRCHCIYGTVEADAMVFMGLSKQMS